MGAKQILGVAHSLHPHLDSDTTYGKIGCMNAAKITVPVDPRLITLEQFAPDASIGSTHWWTPTDLLVEKWRSLFAFGAAHCLYRGRDQMLRGFYGCAGVVILVTLPLDAAENLPITFPPSTHTIRLVRIETVRLEWADLIEDGYTHYTEDEAAHIKWLEKDTAWAVTRTLAMDFRNKWLRQKAEDTLHRGVLATTNPVKDFQSEAL